MPPRRATPRCPARRRWWPRWTTVRGPPIAAARMAATCGVGLNSAEAAAVVAEHRAASLVPMNIDGATAIIYAELGFPAELARGLFLRSRGVGILAHAWEEQPAGGRIKDPLPTPLLAGYHGHPHRDLAPEER